MKIHSFLLGRFIFVLLTVFCGLLFFYNLFMAFVVYDREFGDPEPTRYVHFLVLAALLIPLVGVVLAGICRRRGRRQAAVGVILLGAVYGAIGILPALSAVQRRIAVPNCVGSGFTPRCGSQELQDPEMNCDLPQTLCSPDKKYVAILDEHASAGFGNGYCFDRILVVPAHLREVPDSPDYLVYQGECSDFGKEFHKGYWREAGAPRFSWISNDGGQTLHVVYPDNVEAETKPSLFPSVKISFEKQAKNPPR